MLDSDSNVVGTGNVKNEADVWSGVVDINCDADINKCSVEVKNANDENLLDESLADTYTWVVTSDGNSFTITLYKEIPVNIEWNGYEVSENEVKVNLLDGDSTVVGTGNVKNEADVWSGVVDINCDADINKCSVEVKNANDENLPDESLADTYTWVVTTDGNSFTITLCKKISVKIEWNDNGDRDKKRPTQVAIDVLREKESLLNSKIELPENNNWTKMVTVPAMWDKTCQENSVSINVNPIPDLAYSRKVTKSAEGITIVYNYEEPLEEIKEIPATCTTKGRHAGYKCSICGMYFNEKEEEIKEEALTIAMLPHSITKKEKKATDTKEGKLTFSCENCDYEQASYIIPKKKMTIVLGKSSNIMSDMSDASKCSFSVAKKYKKCKYFKVNQKTGKITTKQYYKEKLASSIPVKVTTGGKTYTTTVKVKIPTPTVKIKPIRRKGGCEYKFSYKVPKAEEIRVRVKGMNDKSLNEALDYYIGKPKSNKESYIILNDKRLRKLGKKVKFQIKARYGKYNWSETITVEKIIRWK